MGAYLQIKREESKQACLKPERLGLDLVERVEDQSQHRENRDDDDYKRGVQSQSLPEDTSELCLLVSPGITTDSRTGYRAS